MKNNKVIPLNKGSFRNIKATPLSKRKYYSQGCKLNGWFFLTEIMSFNKTKGLWGANDYVHLVNGIIHKDDGPAMVLKDGKDLRKIMFFQNGLLHKHEKYSVIKYDNKVEWDGLNFVPSDNATILEYSVHVMDKLHSLEGPACYSLFDSTQKKYYINGTSILMRSFIKHPEVIEFKKKKEVKQKMNGIFIG